MMLCCNFHNEAITEGKGEHLTFESHESVLPRHRNRDGNESIRVPNIARLGTEDYFILFSCPENIP